MISSKIVLYKSYKVCYAKKFSERRSTVLNLPLKLAFPADIFKRIFKSGYYYCWPDKSDEGGKRETTRRHMFVSGLEREGGSL